MKLSLRSLLPVLAAGAATVLSAGCAAEPAASEATGSDLAPIVQEKVHVVDGEPGKDLDVEADRLSASLAQFPDLATYVPGDVIVSGHAAGLLRRVRGARVEGDRVIVDTEAASLEDVFQQVHLRGSVGEPPAHVGTAGLGTRGVFLTLPTMQIANKRLALGSGNEIEVVDGSFSFQPQLDFDLKMQGGKLNHLKVVASGETDAKLHLRYDLHRSADVKSGAFLDFKDGGIPVVEAPPYYAVFWAGYVPVVVAVRARLLAGWGIRVGGDVSGEESVTASGSVSAGMEYLDGGWRDIASKGLSVGSGGQTTIMSHMIVGDVTLTARLDVSFYEIAGPFVGLQAYTGVGHEGSDTGSGFFSEVGLRGLAGAQVAVFGKAIVGYDSVLFDVHAQQPL